VTDLLQDTVLGGQAAWAIGEFPLLIVAIALAVQWSRSDERDARRMDRQADRDGGQELASYNAYLAQLHARDSRPTPPSDPEAQR
jgi:putative copper resistance protein D